MLIEVNYSTGSCERSVTVVPSVIMTVSGVYPFSVKSFFFLSIFVSTKKEFLSLFLSIHPVLIEESNSTGTRTRNGKTSNSHHTTWVKETKLFFEKR